MVLRALAVLAAVAVPLLMSINAVQGVHPAMFWVGPLLAVVCTLPIVHKAGPSRTQALVGAALAAMATASTPEVPELLRITGELETMAVHDLREAPLPAAQDGYVAVRGYLRDEWVVDEYRPQAGERPDQNQDPEAVLLPLLGTTATTMIGEELGRVIVARVPPDKVGASVVTLRGRLMPIGDEIVDSLFVVQVDRQGMASQATIRPQAVLLDTFDVPSRAQALTRAALAGGAALLALLLLLFAIPRKGAAAAGKKEDPR